ncbi:endonuclease [Paenibacillus polysaccharolyticus]|uniref:endonuclease I family protein n=1 Tax=Paenibacillus polysaccharolyticus TaxID=582692 RepID=UPI0020A117A4|nr:endonuclease [Paenibacillus polysaccharolyticus]MCP1133332.1 endonuclease [Paenibacillus polysaccharolyticus]
MKHFSIVVFLVFVISITGCGGKYSIHNNATPNTQNQTTKYLDIHQQDNSGNSYRILNTELDNTYYRNALGKSGAELKQALHNIISEQTVLTYSETENALRDSDEDPNNPNNVLLLYAGRSVSKNPNRGHWNREHVWAQSHGDFGRSKGIGSDLHNLRTEDIDVNNDRGRLDFDITETNIKEENKYPEDKAPDTYRDKDSWEPRDEVKGDVARIILYMDTRYEANDGMDLKVVDQTVQSHSPEHGKLSTLLKWHEADPVDQFEKKRNQIIYEKYQHNRNPFIDHPEWVKQIWGNQ